MGLFNGYMKDGPGVRKDAPKKKAFFAFFDIYIKRFWKLIELNMLYFICCLPIITIGPATAGFTYVLRNYARDSHSFLWSDFFDAVRKNWKQSFIVSLIQFFMLICLIFGISQFDPSNTFFMIYFVVAVFVNVFFTMMMFYVYPMLVTFKFNLKQLFKNAFIFANIGLKTNIITLFLSALLIVSYIILIGLFSPLIILLPLILLSTIGLIINFNVYPYLEKYIIKPYYEEHPEELEKETDEETLFNDERVLGEENDER